MATAFVKSLNQSGYFEIRNERIEYRFMRLDAQRRTVVPAHAARSRHLSHRRGGRLNPPRLDYTKV